MTPALVIPELWRPLEAFERKYTKYVAGALRAKLSGEGWKFPMDGRNSKSVDVDRVRKAMAFMEIPASRQ